MTGCTRSPFNGQLPYHPGGLNFSYETEAVRFGRNWKAVPLPDERPGIAAPGHLRQGLTRGNGTAERCSHHQNAPDELDPAAL